MGFRDFLYNVQNSKLGCKITETKDAVRYSKVGWAVSDVKTKSQMLLIQRKKPSIKRNLSEK